MWQIELNLDDSAAYTLLAEDRIWNGYSIADLVPPFRQYARLSSAAQAGEPATAACLLMRHPALTALISHGDPEGVAAILAALDLPATVFVLARLEHLPALAGHYSLPPGDQMLRMAVNRTTFQPAAGASMPAVRLGADDLAALHELYSAYPGNAFNDDQVRSGVFFGICEGERLVAAGGTHVMAPQHAIAAVGNIFTHPALRGRGYARAVTSAVVATLLDQGCEDVILNVAQHNIAAIRVYQQLGFAPHCPFWEGLVQR